MSQLSFNDERQISKGVVLKMNLTNDDKNLLDKIMNDKTRYSIVVDNDAVYVQDNHCHPEDDSYWIGFDQYGYDFIVSLFEYFGFKSNFV